MRFDVGIPRITKEDLKARLDAEAAGARPLLVDARLKYPYEHSTLTLPGAIRVSPQQPDWSTLPRGRDVVVYDSDPDEIVSAPLVAQLIERGITALALKGGIGDWVAANLPTEPKAGSVAPPAAGESKG